MSGSTTYNVILALSTTGNLGASLGSAAGHAARADSSMRSLGEGAKKVGEGIASMGERLGGALSGIADRALDVGATLAKVGAAAGLALATYGVVKLNQQLETTQISLGAIFQAQGFTSTFEKGFSMAGDQLAKMKQDVKTLPGDLGQLSDIMKMIATQAARGGANPDAIRKLAGRTMLTSTILGVQQEVASREMAGLLSGLAGSHNIFGARLGLIGDEAQKFNKSSPEERLARINAELDKYKGAADRFGQSFVAQWTTLKDNIKYGMLAPATSGLFDRVKESIGRANDYLDTHKDKVAEVASLVNRRLVSAWDYLEDKFKKIEPIIARIADRIAHMQPSQFIKPLENAGTAVLETRAAGMGISGASGLIGLAGRYGPALAGGGGEAMAGVGSAALVAGPALAFLATGLVATYGAVHILTDEMSAYHDTAVRMAASIRGNLTDAFQKLGSLAEQVHLEALVDKMGKDLVFGIESATKGLDLFVTAIGNVENAAQRFWNKFKNDPKLGVDNPARLEGRGHDLLMNVAVMNPTAAAKRGAGGGGGGTHIQKVEIIVTGNNDPSRVARLTLAEIQKLGRNPTRSPMVPNYEAGRP